MNSVTVTQLPANSSPASSQRSQDSLAKRQYMIEMALDTYTNFGPQCPSDLTNAIRHSLLTPGKRLRPLLVLMATEACGGNAQDAMPAACAVEMIHTYSLIHDDLPAMDDDDLRRGRPTCHRVFGEATAILAGDALLALSFEVLARDIKPAAVASACCETLAKASGPLALVGGQCDDVTRDLTKGNRELLESIHNRKTGALFLASLRMGGLIANASESDLAALEKFGSCLGLAFQITDDLLDFDRECSPRTAKRESKSEKDKLTYPNLIGVKESQKEVERLIAAASQALDCMGTKSRGLKALASFVSDRA